jgi:ligand-binding sensor domain-containing protein/serine phosphatase RsbU (regulator of sigma subunit)
MTLSRRLTILLILFLIRTGYAQLYHFDLYTEDNGLAQNYIYSISQSDDGFLYLSTGNGFVSFDGNKFKTYTIRDGLQENFVNLHYIDSRGNLWLGHYQSGITRMTNGKTLKIKGSEAMGSKIICFEEDEKRNIWVAVKGKGVYYIDTTDTLHGPVLSEDQGINCFKVTSDGRLLCGSDAGLSFVNISNPEKPVLIPGLPEFENKSVKYLIRDNKNTSLYWAAIPGEGVYGIKLENGNAKIVSVITSKLGSGSANILSIYSDHESNLWVSLADEGLKKIIFPPGNIKDSYSVKTISKKNGLPTNYIQSVFEDFEYNMWFGTFGTGLIEMPVHKFSFFRPEENADIESILTDSLDYMWLGTDAGFLHYNSEDNSKTVLYDERNGFVKDKVTALMRDAKGLIWIGTAVNGIFTFDPATGKFENFSKKNKLPPVTVNHIASTKKGLVIVATTEGAYFIDPVAHTQQLLTTNEGLLYNNVRHVYCDSKNRIWFSSEGTPPYFLENDEITVLKDIPELRGFIINSVTEDLNGSICICTGGDGIFFYDGKKTTNIRVENGLVSNFCYSAVLNFNNDIWVTHKNGISRIKGSNHQVTPYKKTDGLLFLSNNMNAACSDLKGNLWFGTEEGLVLYNSKRNGITIPEPKIKVLSLSLNDKDYTTADSISLPYGDYNAKVSFIGISLTDASKVLYKYRLSGLDTTWRITDEKIVEFPKLSQGNYTFQVYACNRDGVWSALPAKISFRIGIPIWQRVWFWIAIIVLLGFIIYIFIRSRIRGLLRIKQQLEEKVKEKTYQLRIEKEQIEGIKVILEEKNKDITDSITYAKRIQEALLPTKESFFASFPDSFIYFKPREIVSGDFYWFTETEKCYVIAVVDCTGHGIPGAFMSIIGSTILSDIVIDKKITAPNEILNQLNINIIKMLKQDEEGSSSRDGMDVSICTVDKQRKKVVYSAASRPLYFIKDGILNERKLKNHSIGGSYDEYKKIYDAVEIDLEGGETFYLFSDGFADQFDQADQVKFSSKRLKKMFLDASALPMKEQQKMIDNIFSDWKGTRSQLDDVTIIGFKI